MREPSAVERDLAHDIGADVARLLVTDPCDRAGCQEVERDMARRLFSAAALSSAHGDDGDVGLYLLALIMQLDS